MVALNILLITAVTALLLHTEFVGALKINRATGDSFDNPDCDSKTCPRICSRYDAECEDNNYCTQCHCKKQYSMNFVGDGQNGGRCLTNNEVVKDSVPEKSFDLRGIERWFTGSKCARADPELRADSSCTNDISNLWIRTVNDQFMNLKRLDCMDGRDPKRVVVAPCDPASNAQKWRCNKTINPMNGSKELGFDRDNKLVLDDFGATWHDANNFCKTPIEYKGCYRFNNGETMRTVDVYDFQHACSVTNCTLTYKMTAPVYVQNSQCSLLWKNSTFLKDDQPWQQVSGENHGFSLAYNQQFRGVELKITRDEYFKWNGTILRLEVECRSQNTIEQHCILLKFYSTDIRPGSSTTANPNSGGLESVGMGFHWLLSLSACCLLQLFYHHFKFGSSI